jgi:uncharacterized protein (DUF2336 family)
MSLIHKIFRKRYPPKGDPERYRMQREIAQAGNVRERLKLARDKETNREILYYLGENDPDAEVRSAVIANPSMPLHVSPIMARDRNEEVRLKLAARLVALLPEVSQDEHSQIYAFTVQALGTLALDEVLRIRLALSSTLKDHAHTPPKVAAQLAKDVEREVSEPILRFCTALPDEDLLEIIKAHPAGWTVEAIAARKNVSLEVSKAVIMTQNRPAGKALIENPGAKIDTELLREIISRARYFPEWQKPAALRKALPVSIAVQLAEFVDVSVRDMLRYNSDIDRKTSEEIAEAFRRRMGFSGSDLMQKTLSDRLALIERRDGLTEQTVSDALAMRDEDFVRAALARMASTDVITVTRIFSLRAPKPIVALCWKAGLSMRMALQLQKEMGQVQPRDLVYPKDGSDYPLSEEELRWQLEFLGLKAA